MESIIQACTDIGEFLSLVRLFFSNYYCSFFNTVKEEEEEEEEVVFLMKDEIKKKKKNTPWLLLPDNAEPRSSFSFYSLSEGRFYNLNLPNKIKGRGGGYCCGSSKGWLAIITTPVSDFYPQLFLWNPLSDRKKAPPPHRHHLLQLPSLTTIPCFIGFINRLPEIYSASKFIDKIDITSTMVVAVLCNYKRTLAYCTPGDKRWSIFKDNIGDDAKVACDDILFSHNILYTLFVLGHDDDYAEEEGITSTTINCLANTTSEFQVVVKSIMHAPNFGIPYYQIKGGFAIAKQLKSSFCLVESTQGELLITRRKLDLFIKEEDVCMPELRTTYSTQPPGFKYVQTSGFEVFKLNYTTTGTIMYDRLMSLEDQVLFYSEYGSLSVPTQDFGQGNCIYFISLPNYNVLDHNPKVSREAGVFYVQDGTIKRHLPSFKLPAKSHPCWFMPNLD